MPWNPDRIARLCLGSFSGFGSRSLRKLSLCFASPALAWTGKRSDLIKTGIKESVIDGFLAWRAACEPRNLVRRLEEQNIRMLFPDDDEYPRAFRESSDPPEILFVRGVLKDAPAVSVVGTRHFTIYGKQCVEAIVPELARSGLAIISGMALGIDALAHEAALRAGGVTVAILGTGVDDEAIYPREHFALAHKIIAHGGAVISEFPPGTGSRKEHFPIRNRLIASLSDATVVIEAAPKSGSLITAKLALEENKEVLAVPGPIWSEQSKGTNALIKSGARVCTEARDVFLALALDRPELVAAARATLPLDPRETMVLDALTEPLHVDHLGRQIGMDAPTVSAQLAILELKGLVKTIGGQMWIRT